MKRYIESSYGAPAAPVVASVPPLGRAPAQGGGGSGGGGGGGGGGSRRKPAETEASDFDDEQTVEAKKNVKLVNLWVCCLW